MSEKRYVQHISGKGEKWELRSCLHNNIKEKTTWIIDVEADRMTYIAFPKSEYILCNPPEEWEDVTGECKWVVDNAVGWPSSDHIMCIDHEGSRVEACNNYRLCKVQLWEDGSSSDTRPGQWAFIIERRKS